MDTRVVLVFEFDMSDKPLCDSIALNKAEALKHPHLKIWHNYQMLVYNLLFYLHCSRKIVIGPARTILLPGSSQDSY